MNQPIAAWQDNILSPVDKLEVHKRGLKHPAVSVFLKKEMKFYYNRDLLPNIIVLVFGLIRFALIRIGVKILITVQ